MSAKFDTDLFEYVICQNSFRNALYLSSIIDYYKPSYIQNEAIRFVMDGIVEFYRKTNNTPNGTELKLRATNETQKKYLTDVVNYMGKLDKEYELSELLSNTEQFLRQKAVYDALLTTTTEMSKNILNPDDVLDRFNSACTISLIDNIGLDFFENINKISEEIARPSNVISTGWKWLDDKIGGGWQAIGKALYVFTGFTNVGKSIFLGNAAINMLKDNKTVVLVTLEMPEELYAKRICSNLSDIPMNELASSIEDMKEKLYEFKGKYNSKLIIKEFPTKGMTIHGFNAFIKKLIQKGIKPDAIILDYLNLMKGARSGEGSYEDIKDLSEQLRASTYLFGVPIITATQLNRKASGREDPGMETISESIGVSFTADVQMAIWADQSDFDLGQTHLSIQKNRFGPKFCNTMFKLNYSTLKITEPNKEDMPDQFSDQQLEKIGVDSALDALNSLTG